MKILSANQVGHREAGIPSSGGVLTQEVFLSQSQLEESEMLQNLSQEEDVQQQLLADDDEYGGDDYNGDLDGGTDGDSQEEMDHLEASGIALNDELDQPYSGNAYSDLHPLFQQLSAACQTVRDVEYCKNNLHQCISDVLHVNSERVGQQPPQGMGSFAAVDRRRNDQRLTANSPKRRKIN
jgi:hypothetical protein